MKNTVLVIDDDPAIIAMMQSLLAPRGYQIIWAHDGQDGYWLARTKEPGLIICDLLLPRGTGFEVMEKVRAREALQSTPVILITAVYKSRQYKAKGRQYGVSAFLEKPLVPETLIPLVQRLLPLPVQASPRSEDELEQKIERLRIDYLSKLPAVVDWITNRCHTLLNQHWDTEEARLLHHAAHRMIGCGRNLNLDRMSDAAQRMEYFLDNLLETGGEPTEDERTQLETLLVDLSSAVILETSKPAGTA